MSEQACSERVYNGGSFSGHRCRKPVTREEDGKPWCAQHAPSAVRDRRAKRTARWDAEAARAAYYSNGRALQARLLALTLATTGDLPPEVHAAREAVREHEAAAKGGTT